MGGMSFRVPPIARFSIGPPFRYREQTSVRLGVRMGHHLGRINATNKLERIAILDGIVEYLLRPSNVRLLDSSSKI